MRPEPFRPNDQCDGSLLEPSIRTVRDPMRPWRSARYDRAMRARAVDSASVFADEAMPFLRERAGRNNLPIAILARILDGVYPEAHHWIVERDDVVVGVALRTPPHPLLLAEPADPAAIDALADAVTDAPGVVGNVPWAERFAARGERSWRPVMEQGVYELTAVSEPRPASGSARTAGPADQDLILRWIQRFEDEALHEEQVRDLGRTRRLVDDALGPNPGSGYELWEAGGDVVSLTGFGRFPFGARIGPVYTPPEHRGRGYASNLVARVSAAMLAAGEPACYLYTDMANRTSNRIYTDVGYRIIARSQEVAFGV